MYGNHCLSICSNYDFVMSVRAMLNDPNLQKCRGYMPTEREVFVQNMLHILWLRSVLSKCIMPHGTLINLKWASSSVHFTIRFSYERRKTEGSVPCQRFGLFSKKKSCNLRPFTYGPIMTTWPQCAIKFYCLSNIFVRLRHTSRGRKVLCVQ
jgi:hypothetical protein